MITLIFKMLVILIVSYIIGSIPTGYIIVKLLKKTDIREIGSGSTGATNVKRVLGTKWFFIVLLLDALKGFLPVFYVIHHMDFPLYVEPDPPFREFNFRGLSPIVSAFALIVGHSRSVFLGFTGGKSVATGIGTFLALSLPAGIITALIWAIITFFTKYVSVASIVAVTLSPILMRAFASSEYYWVFASFCAAFVILKHKDNIIRLVKGTENKTEFHRHKE